MLSILIPTYNYNILPLVLEIEQQCSSITNLKYEIVVYDDGSKLYHYENKQVNNLANCRYKILEQNIGRSAIRNLLAKHATFENLLFLDADVRLISDQFISNYLDFIKQNQNYDIVYGGIVYQTEKPENDQLLRWIYGNEREALIAEQRNLNPHLAFLTLNFLVHKNIFLKVKFNENIPNLRYEDMLFSYDLKMAKISIQHINNQVVHNGIENSEWFLKKTNDALKGLKYLLDHKIIDANYARISKMYCKLKAFRMLFLMRFFFYIANKSMKKNLLKENPSLFIFDIYRLAYLSNL